MVLNKFWCEYFFTASGIDFGYSFSSLINWSIQSSSTTFAGVRMDVFFVGCDVFPSLVLIQSNHFSMVVYT